MARTCRHNHGLHHQKTMKLSIQGNAIHCDQAFIQIDALIRFMESMNPSVSERILRVQSPFERVPFEVREVRVSKGLIHLDFMPEGSAVYRLDEFTAAFQEATHSSPVPISRSDITVPISGGCSGGCGSTWKPKKEE